MLRTAIKFCIKMEALIWKLRIRSYSGQVTTKNCCSENLDF